MLVFNNLLLFPFLTLGNIAQLERIVQYCFLAAFLIVIIRLLRDIFQLKIPFKVALKKRTASLISIAIMYIIVTGLTLLN
ncbi:hypothetical protein [Myroides sp. LJL119]